MNFVKKIFSILNYRVTSLKNSYFQTRSVKGILYVSFIIIQIGIDNVFG